MNNILMTRDELTKMLSENMCEVTFTKVNGDTRIMTCTLQKDVIPSATKDDTLSQSKIRNLNEEVIPVWDAKAEGWRSFRVDSVQKIGIV